MDIKELLIEQYNLRIMSDIKERVEELYKIIENAKAELEDIRSYCPHHKTYIGLYQWGGPGHIVEGDICETCGKYLGTGSPEDV